MNYLEVAVHTPPEGVEMISLIFEELGSGGVAIDDPALLIKYIESGRWDHWEFPDEMLDRRRMPVVKGYLPVDGAEQKLACLEERISKLNLSTEPKIYIREIKEEDWATAWQAYYKPLNIGKRFFIKPSWEEAAADPGRIMLELDPGMAFGCGNHPTTTMCLELMENLIAGGEEVCDVGTGSGILAIAAAKLGAASVTAIDLDETAVKVAKENVRINDAADKVRVIHGNLLDHYRGCPDLMIANIIADVIIKLAADAYQLLKPGGSFITSGIIKERAEEVLEAVTLNGFKLKERMTEGEWVAYLLKKE